MRHYDPKSKYRSPFVEKAEAIARQRSSTALSKLKEQRQTYLVQAIEAEKPKNRKKNGLFDPGLDSKEIFKPSTLKKNQSNTTKPSSAVPRSSTSTSSLTIRNQTVYSFFCVLFVI